MNWGASILLVASVGAHAAVVAADSNRGARLFESLACIQCHGVNGKGAQIGPDLGRMVDRNFTPAALAATMWNHAPTMWAAMRERSIRPGELDEQAAADLFAYFYSARFFERPGDAARGKRVFTDRHCGHCHGLTALVQPGIQPVSQWRSLNDPIALAEEMWNHRSRMQAAAGARGIHLPELSPQDLTDLLVYLRNLPSVRATPGEFQTASGANGESLFQAKGCAHCHQTGPAFAGRIRGHTLTEIAAAMWNHAPTMAAAGATAATFAPGEMRELLSYLWAKQFFEGAGDPMRGRRIFSAKHCAICHEGGTADAPPLTGGNRRFSGASIVSALWHHGPAMLAQIKSKGIAWPRFDGREMADLIGYLNSGSTE